VPPPQLAPAPPAGLVRPGQRLDHQPFQPLVGPRVEPFARDLGVRRLGADRELRWAVRERGDQHRAPLGERRREQLAAVDLQHVERDEVSRVPVRLAHR